MFYLRNLSLFVLPFLAVFFAWKRGLAPAGRLWLAATFVVAALVMNLLPFTPAGHTEMLAALHLPMALWLTVGVAYAGGLWRDHQQRMNYVRFSGESFIYYALIAAGGGVLMGITMFIFGAIGLDVRRSSLHVGTPRAAPWAPSSSPAGWWRPSRASSRTWPRCSRCSSRPSSPSCSWPSWAPWCGPGSGINVEREVLIGFDLLLVVVVGLLLYAISARDPQKEPGFFDGLQLLLVVCALLVDALALWAIVARISEFGFSPNRVAALGENLILVVNLGWSAVLYARFLRKRAGFAPAGAVADGLPAGVRGVGGGGRGGLPAGVQLPVGGGGIAPPCPGTLASPLGADVIQENARS